MTAAETYHTAMLFDQSLTIGQRVRARWTNRGRAFHAIGEVIKINQNSLQVRLQRSIYTYRDGSWKETYPIGYVVHIPRLNSQYYSAGNCAEPIE